jgi:hypothetical protein
MANNVLFLPTSTRGSAARIGGCDLARADPFVPHRAWTHEWLLDTQRVDHDDHHGRLHTLYLGRRRGYPQDTVDLRRRCDFGEESPATKWSPLPRRRPAASGKRSEAPYPGPRNPTQAPTRINSGGGIPARFHPLPFLSSFDDF